MLVVAGAGTYILMFCSVICIDRKVSLIQYWPRGLLAVYLPGAVCFSRCSKSELPRDQRSARLTEAHRGGGRHGFGSWCRSSAMGCRLTKVVPQEGETPNEKLGVNVVPRVTPSASPVNGNAAEKPKGDAHLPPEAKGGALPPIEVDRGPMRRKHPMFVIPIRTVLEMTEIKRHEEVRDLLVEWNPGMADVIFVAHSWKPWQTPDPDNVKLDLLKNILGKIVGGKTKDINTHIVVNGTLYQGKEIDRMVSASLANGYVWMDVMSMPQVKADLHTGHATSAIVSYAADCTFFCELGRTHRHTDGLIKDCRGRNLKDVEIWWSRHNSGRITMNLGNTAHKQTLVESHDG